MSLENETPDAYDLILGLRDEVTEADIDFFAENPARLDLLDQRETIRGKRLWKILLLAALFIFLSKYFATRYEDWLENMINSVFVDLIFEMGAALIGSVATVLFLSRQQVTQFRQNVALRRRIEARIAARDTS